MRPPPLLKCHLVRDKHSHQAAHDISMSCCTIAQKLRPVKGCGCRAASIDNPWPCRPLDCMMSVLSPLRSTGWTTAPEYAYLHWFDKVFHFRSGPAQWAQARLVRYVDDFVVMARYQSHRLSEYIEFKMKDWMGLKINREKTGVVKMKEEGASLDFLGYTFQYRDDLYGRNWKYLDVTPSQSAMKREREVLHGMTDARGSFKPLPEFVAELNRHLVGWANYFSFGYPRMAKREINWYVRRRLGQHLRRRSQRPYRPPQGRCTNTWQHCGAGVSMSERAA